MRSRLSSFYCLVFWYTPERATRANSALKEKKVLGANFSNFMETRFILLEIKVTIFQQAVSACEKTSLGISRDKTGISRTFLFFEKVKGFSVCQNNTK